MVVFWLLNNLIFIIPILFQNLFASRNLDLYILLPDNKVYWRLFTFISFIEVELNIYHMADIFTDTDKFTDKYQTNNRKVRNLYTQITH